MLRFKTIVFRYLFILVSAGLYGIKNPPALKYDSTIIKTHKPSTLREQAVFKEIDLGFAKVNETHDISAWDRFWNWLLNLIFGKADYNDKRNIQAIFIWTFVILGLLLALWLFSKSEFSTFLRGNTKNTAFNFEDVEEDISGIDFNKRIEQAKTDQDFRLAIRWLYLKQLFLLTQKNHITWQPYKTNMDYMNELSKVTFKNAFKDISKVYEYAWYDQYTINQAGFSSLELQFKQFETTIGV